MGQDKMLVGCGGLGSDPEAVERIDAPGRGMPLPQVAPHSVGQFDAMHGKPGPPELEDFGDRESGTETLEQALKVSFRDGDSVAIRHYVTALVQHLEAHGLTDEEKAANEEAAARRALRKGKRSLTALREARFIAGREIVLTRNIGGELSWVDAFSRIS